MKQTVIIFFITTMATAAFAQNVPADSSVGTVTIFKDPRIDILAKKEQDFSSTAARSAKGFRLLILKSNDKDYSMKVRTLLLQNFPDQKVYMSFQAPFIKLKFGNFVEKADAEKYRNLIMKGKIVTNNVYIVPEVVEIKPDKTKENESE